MQAAHSHSANPPYALFLTDFSTDRGEAGTLLRLDDLVVMRKEFLKKGRSAANPIFECMLKRRSFSPFSGPSEEVSRIPLIRSELSSATNFDLMRLTAVKALLKTTTARTIAFGLAETPRINFALQRLLGPRQRRR
jgi:hypothetical protein